MSTADVTPAEILDFLKEHMVMKADLHAFATKDDLLAAKSDILITVDRFAKLHETLDHELVAMRSKYERLEERLEAVERKLGFAQ